MLLRQFMDSNRMASAARWKTVLRVSALAQSRMSLMTVMQSSSLVFRVWWTLKRNSMRYAFFKSASSLLPFTSCQTSSNSRDAPTQSEA